MRFSVLGRLRVEPQTPSAAKMCMVLGTLLVAGGEVVSSDSLIDELWGEDPPRTATTTLHVYISHLRKLLADGDDSGRRNTIGTSPPGYLIRATADELDMHRFEALCAEGQDAYARRDFASAAGTFHEALGLWTGPFLAGVPRGRRLEAAADRLELLRLDIGEQRVAAELWLGRHRELIGELTVLAREHPLRETLHGHLIVALYRSHRQSEALAAYDTVRRSLVQELGTDPSAALRELYQRVLRSEPIVHLEECFGDREAAAADRGLAPVVRLPHTSQMLVGRQDQLAAAEALLRGSPSAAPVRVLNVTGAAGTGKTSFSVELAYRTTDLFPDGRVFVDLRGSDGRLLDARRTILRTLRLLRPGPGMPQPEPDAEIDELGDLLHVALSGQRLLLVLDDAGSDAQVRQIVSATSAGTVVITSRRPTAALHGGRTFVLDALAPQEAVEVLASTAAERIVHEPEAARRIATLCGGLPLALRAAGAVLAARPHWSAAKLAARLTDERTRLDVLAVGEQEIRSRLLADYLDLEPVVQRAFRLLVLAPGEDFASWCAAALLGVDHTFSEQIMEQLVQARLLRATTAPGRPVRYGYGDPLRAAAVELLAEDSSRDNREATLRLSAGYITLAGYAQARVAPGRDLQAADSPAPEAACDPGWFGSRHPVDDQPLRWFQQESAALSEVLRRAHAARAWQTVCALAGQVVGYFEAAGEWRRWEEAAGLALDAARTAHDAGAEARALCAGGGIALQRGRFTEAAAAYQQARRRAREAADSGTEGRALIGIGDAESGHGRIDEAGWAYRRASLLCRVGGDLFGLSDALRGIALTQLRAGELRASLRTFTECGRTAYELGDRRWSEYANRAAEGIRLTLTTGGLPDDGPLEVRPGVWAMNPQASGSPHGGTDQGGGHATATVAQAEFGCKR